MSSCPGHVTKLRLSINEPWYSNPNFVRCPGPILASYSMIVTELRSFQFDPAIVLLDKRSQTQPTNCTMDGASTTIHPDKPLSRGSFLKEPAKAGADSFQPV